MLEIFLGDLPSGHAVLAVELTPALLGQDAQSTMQARDIFYLPASALDFLLANTAGVAGVMSFPDDYPPLPPKVKAISISDLEPPRAMAMPDDHPPLPPKVKAISISDLEPPRAMALPDDHPPPPPR